jgi:regulator of RNase E activity RraA
MSSTLDRYPRLTSVIISCDVSDALCELGHLDGGFMSGITMWSPQRQTGATKIVGPAYTVEYVREDDPRPKHPNHYVSTFR